jgi:hypothetical protein
MWLEELGALRLGLRTVAGGFLAVAGCLLAICRGAHATFSRRNAVSSGTAAVFFRTHHVGRARPVRAVSRRGSSVAEYGRSIARHRCEIALAGDHITGSSGREARLCGHPALLRALIAKITCLAKRGRVAAFGEDSIAGCLIAFGRSLIAVGRRLVGVRSRLVRIG